MTLAPGSERSVLIRDIRPIRFRVAVGVQQVQSPIHASEGRDIITGVHSPV
jgi:hypothetical protein